MHLKQLVLKGFKSFANRTVLNLEPGMTVVVGPNGSGKSNISDAVLWVLGEQSAKQLRGTAMEDVIFAGSSGHAAVGVAEVDLVLDNSDGTLPLEFNEVVITRRMYRSGESEYLINGAPSRRLDILDILSDTGLGRDAHSIISQGALQNMLQARPEDRRVLIEEAAGTLKHKKRKERALRKLRSMDAQVERVQDIVNEIDRQLKPLMRQASRAQQHETIVAELRELELTLAVDDLRVLQAEWTGLDRTEKEHDAAVELAKFRADEKSRELEKYQRLLEEKGLFVGDLAEQRRRCQTVLERMDSGMLLVEEKGRNMVQRLSELRQTIHRSSARLAEAQAQVADLQATCVEAGARREELYSQLNSLQKATAEQRAERKAADEELARLSASVRGRERAIDDSTVKLAKANEQLSGADTEDEMLQRRHGQIADALHATQGTLAARRLRLDEVDGQLGKLQRDLQVAKLEINKRVRLLDAARRNQDTARAGLAALQAELKGLEEVDRAFETASPALSWVVAHEEEFAGMIAPVSELLAAPPEYEALVEQLLGADIFGLMVDEPAGVERLAEAIMASETSGGEFALLSVAGNWRRPTKATVGEPLINALQFDPRYERVAEALLGDVYVVGSIHEALNAAQADITGSRFVTREGAVVWPNGKLTVGLQLGNTEGVLARKRRMNVLAEEEIPAAINALTDVEMEVAEADANLQLAQNDGFELSQQLAAHTGEADSLRGEVGRLEASMTALMQESSEIEARRKKVFSASAAARVFANQLREQIEELGQQKADLEEQLARATERRAVLFEQENVSVQQVSGIQVELATVREREMYANKQLDRLGKEVEQLGQQLEVSRETERRLEILRLRVEPLHALYAAIREGASDLAGLLRDRANLEQAGQGDLRSTIEAARANVRSLSEELEAAQEKLNAVRLEKGKLEVQVEVAVNTITREHGVLLDIALETPAPEDRAAVAERAAKLRRKLDSIGAINPVAIEEYRTLKERRDFIGMQLEDLEGARKALDRIVRVIDRKLRNRFVDTFNLVNENFQDVFSVLFPGGKGYLELTDPANPEDSGVEVYCQPRGKKVKQQMLLSGGEKSMAALALLFAVYRTRSTPFYILDEVEAALDDTNLRRLLAYLESIRPVSQIIMISHQRRTMEMADLLYGVSMKSDGVSKLVSQRLDQALRQATEAKDVEDFSGAK